MGTNSSVIFYSSMVRSKQRYKHDRHIVSRISTGWMICHTCVFELCLDRYSMKMIRKPSTMLV
jgi:hypothetical protein